MLKKSEVVRVQKKLLDMDGSLPQMFQALGDKSRFLMFTLLVEREGLCVTDIANIFGTTVSAASQHLKILERAGLVEKKKTGQTVCYSVRNKPSVRAVLGLLEKQRNN